MELNSLRRGYFLDFLLYLAFVSVLFVYLAERYSLLGWISNAAYAVYEDVNVDCHITIAFIVLCTITLFLVLREFWQMFKMRKRWSISSKMRTFF